MAIKRLSVSNFRAFADINVGFDNFNVLVGANASGKTSLVQIFRFIRDVALFDLDNAVSLQGGVKYLRNLRLGISTNFRVEMVTDQRFRLRVRRKPSRKVPPIIARTTELAHSLALGFKSRGPNFDIAEDRITAKLDISRPSLRDARPSSETEKLGNIELSVANVRGHLKASANIPENLPIDAEDFLAPYLTDIKLPLHQTLAFSLPYFLYYLPMDRPSSDMLRTIGLYDFDPKLPKRAVQITGKAELDEDASNLALVLRNVIQDREKRRKFSNLLKDMLPFVEDLDVESFADKSLLFKIREQYYKREYLPASLISDGTITIAALIVALFFEAKELVIIEEPERNIHPSLISKLVDMMKDAAKQKQILITTHSPELVKHAGIESLLLLSRNAEGFSTVSRPADSEQVRSFLRDEIGVDELYAQRLLEA